MGARRPAGSPRAVKPTVSKKKPLAQPSAGSIGSVLASSSAPIDLDAQSMMTSSVASRLQSIPLSEADIATRIRDNALPDDYECKVCDLCGDTTLSPTPFQSHSDCLAWGDFLPWGAGTLEYPKGRLCRRVSYEQFDLLVP